MKIIIAGAGEVGSHLAHLLSGENHSIILIDINKERLSKISETLDVMVIEGESSSINILNACDVENADLFVGVTPEESQNMTACMLASKLGAKMTIARINNYEYLLPKNADFFSSVGINAMIYPELAAAKEIIYSLRHPWARTWWELGNGSVILCSVRMHEGTPLCGKHLSELDATDKFFHIMGIKRNDVTFIPSGKDKILPEDTLYIMSTQENVQRLPQLIGKRKYENKKIMIIGGGRIAYRTSQLLPNDVNVKIIDNDKDRAEKLAEDVASNVSICVGDGTDLNFLIEEGLEQADALISLTGNSETNILSCLLSKQHHVKKSIAQIENFGFISIAEQLGIGTVVNKKLIAAGKIYELLLKNDTSNIRTLAFANAMVGEVIALPNSKVTKKLVKDLNIHQNITLGALIRDNQSFLINGNTQIEPYDKIILFFLNESLKYVESLFN